MKTGSYLGSFDPFTEGHLHVLEVAVKLFDNVVIYICNNPKKVRRYGKGVMKEAIEKVIERKRLTNVTVICCDEDEYVARLALERNSMILVKGVRGAKDYEEEEGQAIINEKHTGLDTIYIRAGKLGFVSSSMVMELFRVGEDISEYVPKEVLDILKKAK